MMTYLAIWMLLNYRVNRGTFDEVQCNSDTGDEIPSMINFLVKEMLFMNYLAIGVLLMNYSVIGVLLTRYLEIEIHVLLLKYHVIRILLMKCLET